MMNRGKREFYCAVCGLFFWSEVARCPHDNCESHKEDVLNRIYSVSSMGFAYYAYDNTDEIRKIAWSSLAFSPESAIEHYTKQGMIIKE